ncbi:MAG: hypothetical protein BA865_00940 [Desulfobacterales bacterium S5133MH4]|nr:MAG: hypothetical protein BA865_00940 [Desulfobacterales bacterium S5133MH4]
MKKILIVDDQVGVLRLYQEELCDEGYDVITAENANKAMWHVTMSGPDLVLLDLFLGGPDGWEVLERIKEEKSRLPVIVVSAYDSYRDDPRLSRAHDYVVKNLDISELKEKIALVLGSVPEHQCVSV